MIFNVFRPRRKKDGKLKINRLYRGKLRLEGESRVADIPLKTSDRQVALLKLNEIRAEREREKAGIIAPRLERESAQKPLLSHLDDFLSDLRILGRCDIYQRQVGLRNRRIMQEQCWKFPADISVDGFISWRSRQTDLGPKTLNEYLNAIRAFLNWMERNGRIADNPLQKITKVETRGKGKRRRAFTDEELTKLLAKAGDRRVLYLTAAYTGLRGGELQKLVWGDLKLNETPAWLMAKASTTKNRRDAVIAIHPTVAEELRHLKANAKHARPSDPVFVPSNRLAPHMRRHLLLAGIEVEINGQKLDFHALRYTFGTRLFRNGTAFRVAQECMRHKDPKLTANLYTDVTQLPTSAAILQLPWHENGDNINNLSDHSTDSQIDSQETGSDYHNSTRSALYKGSINEQKLTVTRSSRPQWALFGKGRPIQTALDAEGFESPTNPPAIPDSERKPVNSKCSDSQLDSLVLSTLCPALVKIVTQWTELPDAIRRAIEALVDSQKPTREASQ